jgi:hypothetical protein
VESGGKGHRGERMRRGGGGGERNTEGQRRHSLVVGGGASTQGREYKREKKRTLINACR